MIRSIGRPVTACALLAAAMSLACSGQNGTHPGGELPDGTVFLVQDAPRNEVMQALFTGTVVRDEKGCLRAAGPEPATIVWPHGSRLERRAEGLYVRDSAGRTLGRVGGSFRFGGGYVPGPAPAGLAPAHRALADDRCPGEYFIVGETHPVD